MDLITDGALTIGAATFAGILHGINGTGEVRPQQISPSFDRSQLLGIDRGAISQKVDPKAKTRSNLGLAAAVGFAVLDPILSGVRTGQAEVGMVDAVIYAEAMATTWAVTNLTKMAVRRSRPRAYIDAAANQDDPNYTNETTDSSLSFFSGHAAMTASVASTAKYLAFARSPGTLRPWLTLGGGTLLTAIVSIERVRGGAHFPTDVIAGAVAGAGVGLLVAHLHSSQSESSSHLWVGLAPDGARGMSAQAGGVF